MAINVTPRNFTVDPMLLPWGNPFKRQEVLYFCSLTPGLGDGQNDDDDDEGLSRCVQIFI